TPLLTNEPALEVLSDSIFNITRGAPLVVNLEGTLLPNSVPGVPPNLHSMQTNLAARALKAMGVSVASLANNHSYDLGEVGFQTTRDELRHLGIASIEHGQFFDLGNARLLAMNHVKGRGNDTGGVLNGDLPNELCFADVEPPVVVFTHWGVEYLRSFDMQTRALARNYVRCGFAVVVGGHSHLAAIGTNSFNDNRGLGVFSLGNLAFDQTGDKGSGALLEIRIFGAGTLAARLIPLPNLFDQMQNAAGHRLKPVR
ncbi:MAG: CapA family protein, partial [Oceanococcus sp.]